MKLNKCTDQPKYESQYLSVSLHIVFSSHVARLTENRLCVNANQRMAVMLVLLERKYLMGGKREQALLNFVNKVDGNGQSSQVQPQNASVMN